MKTPHTIPAPSSPPTGPRPAAYEPPRVTGKRSLESITLSPIGAGDPGTGSGRFGHP